MENNLLSDKELVCKLEQWGLKDSLRVFEYRFNQRFESLNQRGFIMDLLNDKEVMKDLYYELGMDVKVVEEVEYENMRCNCLDLSFFDKLYDSGLVNRTSGYIK